MQQRSFDGFLIDLIASVFFLSSSLNKSVESLLSFFGTNEPWHKSFLFHPPLFHTRYFALLPLLNQPNRMFHLFPSAASAAASLSLSFH